MGNMWPWIGIVIGFALVLINFLSKGMLRGAAGRVASSAVLGVGNALEWVRLGMSIVVTLLVLGCSLYIILRSGSSDDEQKWAFGIVGTVIGYWLKGGAG